MREASSRTLGLRHYDVQPNTAEHLKNRAYYFEPSAETPLGRLWVLPWDSDTSWGPNWMPWLAASASPLMPPRSISISVVIALTRSIEACALVQ